MTDVHRHDARQSSVPQKSHAGAQRGCHDTVYESVHLNDVVYK